MSERFQKAFIPAREFIESWDKEIYELTNLDFFIYQLINYLANQIEKRFFIRERKDSRLLLDFDQLGTLCFNIGDAFEFFLRENCLGSCPLNCPRDLNAHFDADKVQLEEKIRRNIFLLQSFMSGQLEKEQCLRIDLMNYVILDTLLQFYNESFQDELNDDDIDLLELAEFIEDEMVDFVRVEGQTFLQHPFKPSLEYFEELLQTEADRQNSNEWYETNNIWDNEQHGEEWHNPVASVQEVFQKFYANDRYNPPEYNGALIHDSKFLKKYLIDSAQLSDISELNATHLAEFFSIWLVREFVLADEKQLPFIFRATARFITYLFQYYHIDLKKDFLQFYEKTKLDLPRVVKALNTYISQYDLFGAILSSEDFVEHQRIGYFEVSIINDRAQRTIDLYDLHLSESLPQIKLDSQAFTHLRRGDILHASLVYKSPHWEIFDIQFIYPNLAKQFIYQWLE